MLRIAFQGEPGAYSELAAYKFFGTAVETVPCRTFGEVFQRVEEDRVTYGIIPIENSLEGSIGQNYDLLRAMSVKIHGEYIARIVHCLIVNQGVDVKMIRKVYSHPQALGQCRQFLEAHHWEAVATYDTAGSVKMVKEQALMDAAAIASERAAELYQMQILQQGIETDQQNYTRFFILAQGKALQTGEDKTSLIFTLKHAPGTLVKALNMFATRKINLTKIESRPIVGKPWEYHFYVDCEGHIQEQPMQEAMKELRRYARTINILGSYPRAPKSNL